MPKVHILMTPEILNEIKEAIERARKHPLPWEIGRKHAIKASDATKVDTLTLAERISPEQYRPVPPEVIVLPPSGVRCNISFEEQPAGIMRHLSISTHDGQGMLPLMMLAMVARAFGIELPLTVPGHVWMEEYEPGCQALNILVLEVERQTGHA